MDIIREIINLKETVMELLEKHDHLKDDDNRLIATIWKIQFGGTENLKAISAYDFLKLMSEGKIESPESIRRTRQKVQEKCPLLRGSKYKKRKSGGDEASMEITKIIIS